MRSMERFDVVVVGAGKTSLCNYDWRIPARLGALRFSQSINYPLSLSTISVFKTVVKLANVSDY